MPGTACSIHHVTAVEIAKTEIKMIKLVYLGQAILELSKMPMCEFHYDYMQRKHGSKVKLRYMGTDSSVYEIETEDFYKDIAKDVQTKSDTTEYSKVLGMMKDELVEKFHMVLKFVKVIKTFEVCMISMFCEKYTAFVQQP